MTPSEKRAAYRCDVTYVTNQQLGALEPSRVSPRSRFRLPPRSDGSRAGRAQAPETRVLSSWLLRLRRRAFGCAIVDEADSAPHRWLRACKALSEVLIDEGRTPLVISAQAEIPSEKYTRSLEMLR